MGYMTGAVPVSGVYILWP